MHNRYSCEIAATKIHDPEIGEYTTYGITIENDEEKSSVIDVCTKEEYVRELAALFMRMQLSPIHLEEALTDILA